MVKRQSGGPAVDEGSLDALVRKGLPTGGERLLRWEVLACGGSCTRECTAGCD